MQHSRPRHGEQQTYTMEFLTNGRQVKSDGDVSRTRKNAESYQAERENQATAASTTTDTRAREGQDNARTTRRDKYKT